MANVNRNVLSDNRTIKGLFPASTACEIGDLLWYDSSAGRCKRASAVSALATEALDQVYFAQRFMGMAFDQRLLTETDDAAKRVVMLDGVVDYPCSSASFEVGDLIGATRAGGAALVNQQVAGVTNLAQAIGVVFEKQTTVTTVRFRLLSRLGYDLLGTVRQMGGMQGVGVTAMTDANQTLTVASSPNLSMIPTAARTITLPAVGQSAGLIFRISNAAATRLNLTVQNAGATTIGVIAQNQTGQFWCDGATWYGQVGSTSGSDALLGPIASTPATVQDVATGNTITLPTASFVKRLTATAGAATGVIVTAGTVDGQHLTLFNVHATNSITMAAAGTSNVANGTSAVIAALNAAAFVWDSTSARWYKVMA